MEELHRIGIASWVVRPWSLAFMIIGGGVPDAVRVLPTTNDVNHRISGSSV